MSYRLHQISQLEGFVVGAGSVIPHVIPDLYQLPGNYHTADIQLSSRAAT